jgi:hypothetical protein
MGSNLVRFWDSAVRKQSVGDLRIEANSPREGEETAHFANAG